MQRVLIVGAGGHGQVVADILLAVQAASEDQEPVGFLDDNPSTWSSRPLGLPVLGSLAALDDHPYDAVIVAVGNNEIRRKIAEALAARGEEFAVARHPSAIIGSSVEIGAGAMICAGVVVNTGATIGAHAILNTCSSVDHHNHIGAYVHIAPGAHLGGDVAVGMGTLIGIGATVLPQQTIGEWVTVGGGSVVTKPVKSGTIVAGVPARAVGKR